MSSILKSGQAELSTPDLNEDSAEPSSLFATESVIPSQLAELSASRAKAESSVRELHSARMRRAEESY